MADAVEVAIESALLNRLNALVFSPAIPVSLPNISFIPPAATFLVGNVPTPGVWLRATFLPATSVELAVGYDTNQHYGIFQVDVFFGQGGGELAPARIAASILAWFKRGTTLTKDGFTVRIIRLPYRKQMIRDDPWIMIPVSIPYLAYASNPA